MTLDADGRVTVAGHARRNVWRLETLDPKAQITVLADSYQGKKLNSPNDVAYKSDGSLYFTDPPYGLPTQGDDDPLKELQVNGVYRIPGARQQKPGAPPDRRQAATGHQRPAPAQRPGLSPDEKFLYVADSGKKLWMRYTGAAGRIGQRWKRFARRLLRASVGPPDGFGWTRKGTSSVPGRAGFGLFLRKANISGRSRSRRWSANVAWGDKDGKTLYITGSTSIYRIKVKVGGVVPGF